MPITLDQIMAEHCNPDLMAEIAGDFENREEKENMKAVIDEAGELSATIKEMQDRLNTLKGQIKTAAHETGQKEIQGDHWTAKISGQNQTTVQVKSAWDYLKSHGLNTENCFSVKIGEIKKMVGETGLDEMGAVTTYNPVHSISFK